MKTLKLTKIYWVPKDKTKEMSCLLRRGKNDLLGYLLGKLVGVFVLTC